MEMFKLAWLTKSGSKSKNFPNRKQKKPLRRKFADKVLARVFFRPKQPTTNKHGEAEGQVELGGVLSLNSGGSRGRR